MPALNLGWTALLVMLQCGVHVQQNMCRSDDTHKRLLLNVIQACRRKLCVQLLHLLQALAHGVPRRLRCGYVAIAAWQLVCDVYIYIDPRGKIFGMEVKRASSGLYSGKPSLLRAFMAASSCSSSETCTNSSSCSSSSTAEFVRGKDEHVEPLAVDSMGQKPNLTKPRLCLVREQHWAGWRRLAYRP